jgi:cobalt/nickel transport protein
MANQEVTTSQRKSKQGNWWLIFAVISLTVLPLIFVKGEFSGADGEAEELITEIQPDYKPWFEPLFEPASGEIESLLFASQAALGAGVIGYIIGLYKGRNN